MVQYEIKEMLWKNYYIPTTLFIFFEFNNDEKLINTVLNYEVQNKYLTIW